MLASLREYNRDDCESTRQLADWLWALRQEAAGQGGEGRGGERQGGEGRRALEAVAPVGDAAASDASAEVEASPASARAAEAEAEERELARRLECGEWAAESALATAEVREARPQRVTPPRDNAV